MPACLQHALALALGPPPSLSAGGWMDAAGLFFSLDPPPFGEALGPERYSPLQTQRYPASLAGSEVVRLMHHCDYLLKELAGGVETNARTLEVSWPAEPARLRGALAPAPSTVCVGSHDGH